ncbi:sigma 54-interacting transcriptional regulator [Marinobacterium aestuariivivens]|uniref:Sigma 54-interacting transcriptional regulator n=1 Tax=Marinobacterium aestuariivivens TaxID=1698799 RepID=A0ABW1ZW69_9GAMM
MPLDLQPMFLRVLQESEICRIGETRPRKVNFRLVAATHRNLTQEVADGRFRMDLYYRVSSMTLTIPPLRSGAKTFRCWPNISSTTCTGSTAAAPSA